MNTDKLNKIKTIRKASANSLYDKFIIIYKSNRKVRKQNPNLLGEIRFHRDNYYNLIDKYKTTDGETSKKINK